MTHVSALLLSSLVSTSLAAFASPQEGSRASTTPQKRGEAASQQQGRQRPPDAASQAALHKKLAGVAQQKEPESARIEPTGTPLSSGLLEHKAASAQGQPTSERLALDPQRSAALDGALQKKIQAAAQERGEKTQAHESGQTAVARAVRGKKIGNTAPK